MSLSTGGESAVKLLSKFGLLEAAVDYATENWYYYKHLDSLSPLLLSPIFTF